MIPVRAGHQTGAEPATKKACKRGLIAGTGLNRFRAFPGGQPPQEDPDLGAIAQLVERLNGIQEVSGSTPLSSTMDPASKPLAGFAFFGRARGRIRPHRRQGRALGTTEVPLGFRFMGGVSPHLSPRQPFSVQRSSSRGVGSVGSDDLDYLPALGPQLGGVW